MDMPKVGKNSVELTEVRGIFAPTADHTAIKALCEVDRNMLARMVDRGWSDGDMAEYLAANDIVAAEQILKAFGIDQSEPKAPAQPKLQPSLTVQLARMKKLDELLTNNLEMPTRQKLDEIMKIGRKDSAKTPTK
jgi:hypothetical protein